MPTVLLVYVKGGPGSGNWGHAGRPGLRGGSAKRSNPRMRVGQTRRRMKLAKLERQRREAEKLAREEASREAQAMYARWEEQRVARIGKVEKPAAEEDELLRTQVVDKASEIDHGEYGGGYFIREDGKLVDITSDFGGGTNDHVGFMVATENPELIGLTKASVAPFAKLTNDLYVEEKWDWGTRAYEQKEMEWFDGLDKLWRGVFDAGNIRVREHARKGKVFAVAIDGPNLPQSKYGFARLRKFVLDGKIRRSDNYVWEDTSPQGGYLTFSYSDLMKASGILDLKIASQRR